MPWTWERCGGAIGRFADALLADERSIAWDRLVAEEFAPAERERRRRAWVARAHDEYRSMVAFAELLQELTEIAAPVDVIACAARVVRDETRHVALCARVATALGGPSSSDGGPRWVRSDRDRPPRDRVALTMVASLCVGETLSVAKIAHRRANERHPVLRAITTEILADESFHSRFGFAWVQATWPRLPFSSRLYVENALPALLARLAAEQPAEDEALFLRTMTKEILPGLDAAGVRASVAWERSRTCAAS